jgi:ribonuclease Y
VLQINILYITLAGVLFFTAGLISALFFHNAYLKRKKSTAKDLIDSAYGKAEQIKKDQLIQFREELQRKRSKFYEEFKSKENLLSRNEAKLLNKEKDLRRLENNLKYKENKFNQRVQKLAQREENLHEKHKRVDEALEEQNKRLETIAGLSSDDAKKESGEPGQTGSGATGQRN